MGTRADAISVKCPGPVSHSQPLMRRSVFSIRPSAPRCPSLPDDDEQNGCEPQQSADAGIPIATGRARVVWSERCTSQSSRREHSGSSPCGPGGKRCVQQGSLANQVFSTKIRESGLF